jgi:hypothetical protein
LTVSGNVVNQVNAIQLRDLSFLTAPVFAPVAGTYQGAQPVTLTAEAGSTIYYTVNGSPGTFTAGVLCFTKGADAIANGDVTYVIETSDNLGSWTPQVTHTPPNTSPTISHTLPSGLPRESARLKATIR